MNLKKIDFLFFIFLSLQACPPPPRVDGEGNIVVREGNVTIFSPQINVNYSYTDIVNGIKSANIIIDILQSKSDSLAKQEEKIKEDKSIKPEEVNKRLLELNKERQKINQKNDSVNKMRSAWEGVGFTNDEYREKTDKVDNLFSKLKVLDFEVLVGLKKGDFASTAIDTFGNPTKDTDTQLTYVYQGKTALVVDFFKTNGKIFKISIYGKEGHDFVLSKGVAGDKHKLLGLKRYKIQEYLGKPHNIASSGDIEYCFSIENKRALHYDCDKGEVYFNFSENNTCKSIILHWREVRG